MNQQLQQWLLHRISVLRNDYTILYVRIITITIPFVCVSTPNPYALGMGFAGLVCLHRLQVWWWFLKQRLIHPWGSPSYCSPKKILFVLITTLCLQASIVKMIATPQYCREELQLSLQQGLVQTLISVTIITICIFGQVIISVRCVCLFWL